MSEPAIRSNRRRRSGAPTIYDIAEAAGVNPSTVSRALSKPGRVSAATSRRIEETAQSLNYQVNPIARALHTGRMNTVGLIVSDLTNPMFFEIVRGAQDAAANGNYTLLLAESEEDPQQEMIAAQRMAGTVDGLILATSRLDDAQIQTLGMQKPVVVINREVPRIVSIAPDATPGIQEAMDRLADFGHRAVTYVAGPDRSWVNHQRRRALEIAAQAHGMGFETIQGAAPTRAGGAGVVPELLTQGTPAVIAYNDLMAIGMLQECQTRGIHVPGELSIVGFDDIFGADLTSPPLTTVRFPLHECGAAALAAVVSHVENAAPAVVVPGLGSELVLRGSAGAAAPNLPYPLSGGAR